ncbi:MAG: HEPN domain-containing protein [Ktedonobacteraceae bacterium]|nr:HEPN domain-containing protein [Ktedonobacteraceae bacterium]
MSQMPDREQDMSGQKGEDDLEQILLQGISLQQEAGSSSYNRPAQLETDEEDEDTEVATNSDVQGALGLFAEATQDLATASVELSLGRHFACVDFCNQAAEKAAQAVSLLRFGHRSRYDHDLRALGELVGMPPALLDEMEKLTPFHPEIFHADTPPEEADEVISAEQASSYVQSARNIQRWARSIVLAI